MVEIKKSPDDIFPGKGEWVRRVVDGKVTAEVGCPGCGNYGSLADHTIAPDGTVSPSMECPWKKENGCAFHDSGRLVGWQG